MDIEALGEVAALLHLLPDVGTAKRKVIQVGFPLNCFHDPSQPPLDSSRLAGLSACIPGCESRNGKDLWVSIGGRELV